MGSIFKKAIKSATKLAKDPSPKSVLKQAKKQKNVLFPQKKMAEQFGGSFFGGSSQGGNSTPQPATGLGATIMPVPSLAALPSRVGVLAPDTAPMSPAAVTSGMQVGGGDTFVASTREGGGKIWLLGGAVLAALVVGYFVLRKK